MISSARLSFLMAATVAAFLARSWVATPSVRACLWDYDTFKEESLGKRELVQVLGGDLQKHSRGFYEAKVTYTRPMIDGGDAPKERYDDLAVALAKLGRVDEAIAVMEAKEQRFPGEYTTLANWGTFLGMKGDLQGSLDKLKVAVAKWPDAHFGREVFQLQLLEHLLRAKQDPKVVTVENLLGLPMDVGDAGMTGVVRAKQKGHKSPVPPKAIEAMVGMIRFGEAQDLPMVWSALGWALLWKGDTQLALRAMRRAERLGDAVAGGHGGVMATIVHDLKLDSPCCPAPGSPSATAAWAAATKRIDREWAAGEAATKRRQAAEDRKIAKAQAATGKQAAAQWKAIFGY